MTGEKLLSIYVAYMELMYLSVRSYIRRGGDVMEVSSFKPTTNFTLIEYMIIWCKTM